METGGGAVSALTPLSRRKTRTASQAVRSLPSISARLRATMSYFSRTQLTYIDAILGWHWYAWQDMRTALAGWYPTWPTNSRSYPTRLLGDTTSAILVFTDTPGMFGPGQVRNFGAVNSGRDGRIERWVDYWDARQFGVAGWQKEREPPAPWPTDFRQSTVGETAPPLMRHVATSLANALRAGDISAAMRLFSTDAVYEDVPAHLQITSRASIQTFLTKASPALPYIGADTGLRHVLGNDTGGGYEWTADDSPVPRGITGLRRGGLVLLRTAQRLRQRPAFGCAGGSPEPTARSSAGVRAGFPVRR